MNATQPAGTPAPQAKLAYHHAEGTPALLAIALRQTIYIAVIPDDLDRGAVLDCTSETDLPLSSMTSFQASHQIRCLAFSPSGDKLAAVNSAEQVMLQCCRACLLKYTACHKYACVRACAFCEASCNCLLGTLQPNVQGCAHIMFRNVCVLSILEVCFPTGRLLHAWCMSSPMQLVLLGVASSHCAGCDMETASWCQSDQSR